MERVKKYLFYAFVGTLPVQTVYFLREIFIGGEKWQYGTIALYFSDILLVATLALFVISSGYLRKIFDFRFSIFDLQSRIKNLKSESVFLIMLILWAGLSILWAPDQALAGYFFIKLSLAVGVFFLVRSLDEKESKRVVLLLVIGAALEGALGIGQFLAQSTFASTWLGMSAHEVWQAGSSVLKLDSGRWLRAYGTLPHPNMLGGFLAAVLMVGIGFFALFGKEWIRTVLMTRATLRESGVSLRERFLDTVRMSGIVAAGMLILLGLFLSFSRSAWLGAAMGIVVYGIWCSKYQAWRRQYFWVLGVLGIAGIIFTGVLHEAVFPRFDTVVIEREGSVSERVQSLRDAERVIGEGNLWLGTGAGNFTAAVMRLEPNRPVWSVQPVHNIFVLLFAELGIVGCTLLFVGLLAGVASAFRKKNILLLCILFTLLPAFFLDHWLWTSHFGLLFLALLIGISARK